MLSKHDKILVCPRGMATDEYTALLPGLRIFPVDPKWMSSYIAYNDLKSSPLIFAALQDEYRFLLCHEPDVFVFRDEVEQWCDTGFDYIGAPWFSGRPIYPDDAHIIGVGNSGFSLRNNDAQYGRTGSWSCSRARASCGPSTRSFTRRSARRRADGGAQVARDRQQRQVPVPGAVSRWRNKIEHEDLFWTQQMARVLPWFKVADEDTAMRFSFEVLPHKLYEMTGHQLPFGCHGWFKFGLEFWRPFIEAEGHELHASPRCLRMRVHDHSVTFAPIPQVASPVLRAHDHLFRYPTANDMWPPRYPVTQASRPPTIPNATPRVWRPRRRARQDR